MRFHDVIEMAHLDELRAIEVEALDVKPTALRDPNESTLGRLGAVRSHVIASGMKQLQALWRIACGGIVAFESVAGGASIDEILNLIRAPFGQRVNMVHLQLATHGCLGYAAVAASAIERGSHGRPGLRRDRHLRRQRFAREPGERVQDRGLTFVELRQEAPRVVRKELLLSEHSGKLFVPALNSVELALDVANLCAQAVHRRRKHLGLFSLDTCHEIGKLRLLGLRQRASKLVGAEAIQSHLIVRRPGHGAARDFYQRREEEATVTASDVARVPGARDDEQGSRSPSGGNLVRRPVRHCEPAGIAPPSPLRRARPCADPG